MPKLNTDPESAADIQALHQRLDSSGTDQNILTSRRPQARAALTSFPMYMSIRFFHFAGILSSTTYSLLSPSILTLVPLFRPIDSRSADTAMAFIPGVILSPHAPTLGSPWPCFGSELNAVAVTLRVRCCSRVIFWEVEQEVIIEMLRRKKTKQRTGESSSSDTIHRLPVAAVVFIYLVACLNLSKVQGVIVFPRVERIIFAGQTLRSDRIFVDDPTFKVNPGDCDSR